MFSTFTEPGDTSDIVRKLRANLSAAGQRVVIDGHLGEQTLSALNAYERANWLQETGKKQSVQHCTRLALWKQETCAATLHDIPRVIQLGPYTCWAPCTSVLTDQTQWQVQDNTPKEVFFKGQLRNYAREDWTKLGHFAQVLLPPQSWKFQHSLIFLSRFL